MNSLEICVTADTESHDQPSIVRSFARDLQCLIESAADYGVVLTIELEPVAPFAMGSYVMRGHVRGAR